MKLERSEQTFHLTLKNSRCVRLPCGLLLDQGVRGSASLPCLSVFLTDAMLGHSLPGLVVPALEHGNPPPLKEPAARGFLGFLR